MELYNANAVRLFLGALAISPSLIFNDKIKLSNQDFECNEFHLRLFQAIQYLAKHGASQITPIDIYTITKSKKNNSVKQLFDSNNLNDFMNTIKQLTQIDNWEVYYDEIKKYTVLRLYHDNGFDITNIIQDIDNYNTDSIIAYYEGLNLQIRNANYRDSTIEEVKAGESWESFKEEFKKEPMFGATTFSEYLNTATRGWCKGQLSCYSVPSGGGKTTVGIYNLTRVCCPELWNYETEQYEPNPCYQGDSGMYIQFEMSLQTELVPKFVASISGVSCNNIFSGRYYEGEEERVDKAIEILKKSNIYLILMPNYTIDTVENYIKEYTLTKNVQYVVYDYIAESASFSNNMNKKTGGTALRTDQTLLAMASGLKDMAVKYNVAIMTFTQVNRGALQSEQIDATVIASAMSIQNKCDVCAVILPVRKTERETVELAMQQFHPNAQYQPNRIVHTYKIRLGATAAHFKIVQYWDLSTGRVIDYFVLNDENKPINMQKTKLVVNKGE